MDNEPDPRFEIVLDEAIRMITEQQATLDNLRTRAGVLVSAAAVVTSFLGGEALRQGDVGGWGLAATTIFALLLVPVSWVLWPRGQWEFKTSPRTTIRQYINEADMDINAMRRDLALHIEDFYDSNEESLNRLMWMYAAGIIMLVTVSVAWLLELGAWDALRSFLCNCF